MSVDLSTLAGLKVGSIPYYSVSGWTYPTNDPTDNYIPTWSSGHLIWAPASTALLPLFTAQGSILRRDHTGNVSELTIGTAGQVLGVVSDLPGRSPAWEDQTYIDHGSISGLADDDHTQYLLRSLLTTRGDMIFQGNAAASRLAVGGANTVLRSDGAVPNWGTIDKSYIDNRTRERWITNFCVQTGTPTYAIRGSLSLYPAWNLADAATNGVVGTMAVPDDWASGTVEIAICHTNLGAGSGNVRWNIGGESYATGEGLNSSFSVTAQTIAAPAQNIQTITVATATITVAANEIIYVIVQRLGADAADTLTNDAGLIGVRLRFTADM